MLSTFALLSLLVTPGPGPGPHPQPADLYYRPRVEVWTNRGDDPFTSGQTARVYFRADQDAYVTILQVDTDGRVRVLFPREPWEDNFASGGRDYEVLGASSRDAFYVDDYPGVGYVFGVAAADPFTYGSIETGDHWDFRLIADGRVRGDPYVALTDLAQRIVPDGYTDWDYDLVPYYVERHYDYPRFLCYDCHTHVSYPYWSPYDYTCVRFRIVVYDDPYYYPYRYYGGTRVVFTRPYRPEPRFIFKDRQGSSLFITRVKQRPAGDDRRGDVGVRGRDLGGTGLIPPPRRRPVTGGEPIVNEPPRQRPITGEPGNDAGEGRRRPDRPEHRDRPDRPDRPNRPDQSDQPERRDRPERPDNPRNVDRPDRPERRERPDRPREAEQAPQFRPERVRPEPSERPRPEPRREPESRPRAEPRREPEIRPRAETPQPSSQSPRNAPRAEPKRDDKPNKEPELKRRKP